MEIRYQEWSFPAVNGEGDIFARAWLVENPTAIIQLAHGMSEHSGRYDGFARYLCTRGFCVVAGDIAGHGRSVHSRLGSFSTKAGGFDCAIEDCHRLFALGEERIGARPRILFGHSMGGILAGLYADRHAGLSALLLCAPPAGLQHSRLLARIAGFVATFRGHSAPSPLLERLTGSVRNLSTDEAVLKRSWLSRDEEEVRKFTEDPLCGFDYTAGGYATMLEAYHFMYSSGKWGRGIPDIPILFAGGAEDPQILGSPKGSQNLGSAEDAQSLDSPKGQQSLGGPKDPQSLGSPKGPQNLGGAEDPVSPGCFEDTQSPRGLESYARQLMKTGHSRVELKLFPDMRHDLLNEIGREEVYRYFANWLAEK